MKRYLMIGSTAFIVLVILLLLPIMFQEEGYGVFPLKVIIVDPSEGQVASVYYNVTPTWENAKMVANRLPDMTGFSAATLTDGNAFSIRVPFRKSVKYADWEVVPYFHYQKIVILFIMADGEMRFAVADIPIQRVVPGNPVVIQVSVRDTNLMCDARVKKALN